MNAHTLLQTEQAVLALREEILRTVSTAFLTALDADDEMYLRPHVEAARIACFHSRERCEELRFRAVRDFHLDEGDRL